MNSITYELWGRYHNLPWELIDDAAKTIEEYRYLRQEYGLAFGPGWQYKCKRRYNHKGE